MKALNIEAPIEITSPGVDLASRAMPRQKRAIERRAAILQAMLALLAERDVDEISTTLVAQRAGVPVASVYRYFPNKFAMVSELAREAMDGVDSRLEAVMVSDGSADSIAAAIDRCVDTVLEGYRGVAGLRRLFQSVRFTPELDAVLVASDERMIRAMHALLAKIRPDLARRRAEAIARTSVHAFTQLQSQAIGCEDPELYPLLVEEWRRLMKAYLMPYATPAGRLATEPCCEDAQAHPVSLSAPLGGRGSG